MIGGRSTVLIYFTAPRMKRFSTAKTGGSESTGSSAIITDGIEDFLDEGGCR